MPLGLAAPEITATSSFSNTALSFACGPVVVGERLGAGFLTAEPSDDQREQDDGAVGGVDPERGDLRQRQQVLQDPEQDDAGEGTEQPPLAAVQVDPADH